RSGELRAQWGADEASLVLLVVGRLAAEKNLEIGIRAFEAVALVHRDVRLVFVGDGPQREGLQQRCPSAVFVGQMRQDALAACYASADLCLFPSLTETFGNVTLEALSSGLPVLAFDTAAAAEWLEPGVTGWMAPAGDALAYVALARELAANPLHITQASTRARQQVAQLDWQQIAAQVEAVFTGVMARHVGRAVSAGPPVPAH
ncbi:MAG: glycosyltransferase, partial [Hydrogenophaga sp.]|nr:glycosyltransferase [Hydrogenophaga sp.]